MRKSLTCLRAVLLTVSLVSLVGCAGNSGPGPATDRPVPSSPSGSSSAQGRIGTRVAALEFVMSHENTADASYYPLERPSGVTFAADGTLIFCDESRGKVYGLEVGAARWYEFDAPLSRPYRPVDVQVDGFKILVLDRGGDNLFRFDLSGRWQDQLLDVARVDPAVTTRGLAFDVDRDGRLIIADEAQQQVLLLDAFLTLNMRLGEPGSLDDQFGALAGVTFLPDGSILASDTANSRLSWYGRLGFFERTVGGFYAADNVMASPSGLDCDRFGNVFVADPGNSLIHVLDARFRPVFSAGRDFSLRGTPVSPVDVAVGPDDLLAVIDQARTAILVYRIIYE
jgi:hypothetical protein|nr:NHL repeat-containing protein [Candidatus Krumholzibacteria bacterium]